MALYSKKKLIMTGKSYLEILKEKAITSEYYRKAFKKEETTEKLRDHETRIELVRQKKSK